MTEHTLGTKPTSPCIESPIKSLKNGYPIVERAKGKKWRHHRWVYTEHHGPIPEGLHVLHKCDNRRCINIDHLFLGSHQENMRDMVLKGRQNGGGPRGPRGPNANLENVKRGTQHPSNKLTEEQVRDILRGVKEGETVMTLSKRHGVSRVMIRKIRDGKSWAHLAV